MVLMVGSTPIIYSAKRQGCISTSTYSAELMAVREATVKLIELRLLMRSLGVVVRSASKLYCDNLGVFQSVGEGESATKRHTSIAYHLVRETVAAGIMKPCHIEGVHNPADLFTKSLTSPAFVKHRGQLMYLKGG